MNRGFIVILAGAVFSLVLNPLCAQTPKPWVPDSQFSADEQMLAPRGISFSYKMHFDSGNMRVEASKNGMTVVFLFLSAKKKIFAIFPGQHEFMQMDINDRQSQQLPEAFGNGNVKIEFAGADSVNGIPCTKYKVTAMTDSRVSFWWINDATGAPVKTAVNGGTQVELWTNYKAGPQDASLFEPPTGYERVPMPPGMYLPGGISQ